MLSEQLEKILVELGGDVSTLKNNLISCKLDCIITAMGGTPISDGLVSSKLRYIAELANGSTESSSYTEMIDDIIAALGGECDSRLLSEQLDVIINVLENENVLDYDRFIAGEGSTFSNGSLVQDTGSSNVSYSKIFIETSKNWSYVDELARFETTGNQNVPITIDSSIDMFRIAFFGDTRFTSIYFNTDYIEDGNYILSFRIDELSLNHAVITSIKVVRAAE